MASNGCIVVHVWSRSTEGPEGGPSISHPLSIINVFLMELLLLTSPSFHYGSTGPVFTASATLCSALSPPTVGSAEGQQLQAHSEQGDTTPG